MGRVEQFQYDVAGRETVFDYDPLNHLTKVVRADGSVSVYTYNARDQIVEAENRCYCGFLISDYKYTYDANGNMLKECYQNCAEISYQYDTENRLTAVYDRQKLLMAASYDGDGNRAFQLNYNPEAVCGYGKNVNGEVFLPENSRDEDGNLTAEGELFGYICSATGRSYDLTEYVNIRTGRIRRCWEHTR